MTLYPQMKEDGVYYLIIIIIIATITIITIYIKEEMVKTMLHSHFCF